MFSDNETENWKFFHVKNLICKNDVDCDNKLISNKISCSEKNYKYFIDYMDNDCKTKPSSMLPKMNTSVKIYHGKTKQMYFFIEDNKLFKKN